VRILDFLHSLKFLVSFHVNICIDLLLTNEQSVLSKAEKCLDTFYDQNKWLCSLIKHFEKELNEELYV